MTVDSTLSLFTTLYGWQFYGVIWSVLTSTGIAFLPFFFILVQTFIDIRTEGDFTRSAPDIFVSRIETKVLMMFVVIILAAQPSSFTRLSVSSLQYHPHQTWIDPTPPVPQTVASSGSTFGTSGGGFSCFSSSACGMSGGVEVPVWWYATMAISQGINRSVLADMPELQDIRSFIKSVQWMNIDDPALRAESSLFYSECYIPAKASFYRDRPPTVSANSVDWLGADYLVANYYPIMRSKSVVHDSAFDPTRDTEWEMAPSHGSGKPNCDQWWSGVGVKSGGSGLREKLLGEAQKHGASAFAHFSRALRTMSATDFEDHMIERLLQNSPPAFSNEDFQSAERETKGEAQDRSITTWLVGKWSYLTEGAKYDVILFSSPMVQALLLMGVYVFLPFAMVVSRYSPAFMVTGSIIIFTIMFWTVIWYVVAWVDDQLIRSIFPQDEYFIEGFSSGPAKTPVWSSKHDILNFIVISMNLVFLVLFSAVMGWAGVAAATSVGRFAQSSPGQSSMAASASNFGSAGAKMAVGLVGNAAGGAGRILSAAKKAKT